MPFLTQTINPTMYKTQPFVSFKTDFTKWARCKQINKWDLVQSCNPRLVGPKESQKKGMERPKATSGSDDPSHSPVGLLDPLQGWWPMFIVLSCSFCSFFLNRFFLSFFIYLFLYFFLLEIPTKEAKINQNKMNRDVNRGSGWLARGTSCAWQGRS